MNTQAIITQLRALVETTGKTCYSPLLPQTDIECTSINIVTGLQETNLNGGGEYYFSFSVQVRGYKENDTTTRQLCDAVYNALHLQTTNEVISILGNMPSFIGIDDYGRYNYAIVFNAIAKGE